MSFSNNKEFLGDNFSMPHEIPFSWEVFFSSCFELDFVGLLATNCLISCGLFLRIEEKLLKYYMRIGQN